MLFGSLARHRHRVCVAITTRCSRADHHASRIVPLGLAGQELGGLKGDCTWAPDLDATALYRAGIVCGLWKGGEHEKDAARIDPSCYLVAARRVQ